jgi:hypothetical protein
MPRSSNQGGPCRRGVHDGVVKGHGKEHHAGLALLALQGCFDFGFNPGALGGTFGKDDEQLVVEANRLVNRSAELVADREVFRSQLAPDSGVLEVAPQELGKFLVCRRV